MWHPNISFFILSHTQPIRIRNSYENLQEREMYSVFLLETSDELCITILQINLHIEPYLTVYHCNCLVSWMCRKNSGDINSSMVCSPLEFARSPTSPSISKNMFVCWFCLPLFTGTKMYTKKSVVNDHIVFVFHKFCNGVV